jgi:hypothetical protein
MPAQPPGKPKIEVPKGRDHLVRILIAMATVLALVVGRGPRSDATRLEVEPKTFGVAKGVRLLADLSAWKYGHAAWAADGRRLLLRGPATAANWSGRFMAVHRPVGGEMHLQVLENPLTAGHPVPIEEALRAAHAAALKWRPQVELLRGISQQTDEEREAYPPAGIDGRRRAWAFEFVDPATHAFIIVGTWDGKVTKVLPAGTDTAKGFDPKDFRVEGRWLAEEARKAGIRPATGGMAGYLFQLAYSDVLKRYVVTVVGVDAQGKSKGLTVDPRTGEILSIG